MSTSLLVLVAFAAWTLVLVACTVVLRVALVLGGARAANGFSPGGEDVSPFAARLARAHANCVETLPVVAALVLAAEAAGRSLALDPLAPVLLVARVGQTLVHVVSTSALAVQVRFTFFAVQLGVLGWWAVVLLGGD